MGYKANFLYNGIVSADDLNGVGANLQTTTATTFEDNIETSTDDLNMITKNLTTKGVNRGIGYACEVAVNTSAKTILIKSGVVYFGCGVSITVDSAGITLSYTAGQKNYVYFYCNSPRTIAGAKCSTTAPAAGADYVMLAEISSTGVLSDKREWAQMRNASLLPNLYSYNNTFTVDIPKNSSVSKTIDLGGDYKKIYMYRTDNSTDVCFYMYMDFTEGYVGGFYACKSFSNTEIRPITSTTDTITIGINGGWSDYDITNMALQTGQLTITFRSLDDAKNFTFNLEVM